MPQPSSYKVRGTHSGFIKCSSKSVLNRNITVYGLKQNKQTKKNHTVEPGFPYSKFKKKKLLTLDIIILKVR